MLLLRARIADQLRQRVYGGIHLGTLAPGQRLVSVRQLARELDADPRVVMAAYRELEAEGLVEIRPRAGIFIPATETSHSYLRRRAADWMVDLMVEGWDQGISAKALPDRIRESLETRPLRVVCFECNHDQIASLTDELRLDYGVVAIGMDTYSLIANATPAETVRRADLLVTTPFHIVDVEPVAAALSKPLIVAELRVDPFMDIARRLPHEEVYFVVEDPRFAVKLVRIYRGAPGANNLHPLVLEHDDLGVIPAGAATYVSRLARERMGSSTPPKQAIYETRAFSRETSRQIFSFIVDANRSALRLVV